MAVKCEKERGEESKNLQNSGLGRKQLRGRNPFEGRR